MPVFRAADTVSAVFTVSLKTLLLLYFLLQSAVAEPLMVAFGLSRPPYVDEQTGDGISPALFKEVANRLGWQFDMTYVSNGRMEKLLLSGNVDIAVEMPPGHLGLYYSKPFVAYHNFAIHRDNPGFTLSNIDELQGYSICAWQQASQHLGNAQQMSLKKDYFEYAVQKQQVADWVSGKCDVILIDDALLEWHLKSFSFAWGEGQLGLNRKRWGKVLLPVTNNPLWFYVGFREQKLRDDFDTVFDELVAKGEYERVRTHYINTLRTN
ncbi:transporter substrate-binding domain-containing protein [Aliiglaciecola sp. CAU 1673]|uniref:substrate-binding periplasmic protein n=1 Tax=Aliiglaciecola sp. CAU 1673 TaxID=3032595 RepID=UPI0023DCC04E|nr:transporter substrate-binding domain-containing protein [Aliiglaciecola sp. CAU 1673]MDF2180298.1 transporter substrate-binding domain-containing protein [Aliiglaciecola sp. CAU 1673]